MSFSSFTFHEMVLQLLFSLNVGESSEEDLIPFLMRQLRMSRKSVREAYERAQAVYQCHKSLDEKIGAISEEYALERIGKVERNVLRLAFFELLNEIETPREKVIAEALRLTRKFSTKEATAFVNAILDSDTEISSGSTPALSSPEE
ncbi:MAG: Transcription antitermination protein NusB [Chlamydiales bacterium]|nr:Transcription antitermination protein NusB [Chlamydiales bacterium]